MSTATASFISVPLPEVGRGWSTSTPRVVATSPAGTSSLHLTRRGRLAITTTVALAVAVLAATLFSVGVMGPASAASSVVVEPGTTLSQVAQEHLPGLPLSQAIADIQQANRLSGTSIAVGQELVIPGR